MQEERMDTGDGYGDMRIEGFPDLELEWPITEELGRWEANG
jgi:hypothetical protein